MSTPKEINLAEAFQPIPPVRLRDGRLVTVKPFSGLDIELRKRVVANPDDAEAWYTLAKRCLPGLAEDEVMQLTEAEVVLIGTIAAEKYEIVNALIDQQGKARALVETEGDDSAPSSSIPETASGTSALSLDAPVANTHTKS
jgi:hypothetical protein